MWNLCTTRSSGDQFGPSPSLSLPILRRILSIEFIVSVEKAEPTKSFGAYGTTFSDECRSMFTVGTWLFSVAMGLNSCSPCTVMEWTACAIVSLKFSDRPVSWSSLQHMSSCARPSPKASTRTNTTHFMFGFSPALPSRFTNWHLPLQLPSHMMAELDSLYIHSDIHTAL